jgi:hypothetical protein
MPEDTQAQIFTPPSAEDAKAQIDQALEQSRKAMEQAKQAAADRDTTTILGFLRQMNMRTASPELKEKLKAATDIFKAQAEATPAKEAE